MSPPITKAKFDRGKRRLLAVLKEATRRLPEFESRDETIGSFLNESIVAAYCAARLGLPRPPIEHVPIPPPDFVHGWSVSAHNANICGMKFNEPDRGSVYLILPPPSQAESVVPPPGKPTCSAILDDWCRLVAGWESGDVEYSGLRIVEADRSVEELVFNCELSLAIAQNEASVEDIFTAFGPSYIEVLDKQARAIRAAALRELELKLVRQPRQPTVQSSPLTIMAARRALSLVRHLHEQASAYRESYRAQKVDDTKPDPALPTASFDPLIMGELTNFLVGHGWAPTAEHFESRCQELLAQSIRLFSLVQTRAQLGEIIVARVVLNMQLDGLVGFLAQLWSDLGGTAQPAQDAAPSTTPATAPDPDKGRADESSCATDGELTLAEASREFDVPSYALTRAADAPAGKPGHLPTRRDGSNRLVTRAHAKSFADNYDARRERRLVGSQSAEGRNAIALLKKMKKNAPGRAPSKQS